MNDSLTGLFLEQQNRNKPTTNRISQTVEAARL